MRRTYISPEFINSPIYGTFNMVEENPLSLFVNKVPNEENIIGKIRNEIQRQTPQAAYTSQELKQLMGETETNFQEFTSDEKILILAMFEEFPDAMQRQGELKYMVRRVNGQKHPLYPDAPAIEEALVVLIKSYDAMGMKELRDDAKRVYDKNFPNGTMLVDGGKKKSWWKIW